ncbi:MAG: glycine cleavage system protein H [Bacteroidota bacterium]
MTVLLFISTIVVFLTIDYFVRRNKAAVAVAPQFAPKQIPMRIPAGIFFTKSHTWLSLFPSGKVQLGIDDFLARMFSSPSITMLKNNLDHVSKGEPILRVSEGKNEVIVRSPIDGTVDNTNAALVKKPSLLSEALFSEGWAYTIMPTSTNDLRQFYLGDDTRVWLREEMGRLRDFFAHLTTPVPAFMQDGGLPANGIMDNLNPDQCKKFENEFLTIE